MAKINPSEKLKKRNFEVELNTKELIKVNRCGIERQELMIISDCHVWPHKLSSSMGFFMPVGTHKRKERIWVQKE